MHPLNKFKDKPINLIGKHPSGGTYEHNGFMISDVWPVKYEDGTSDTGFSIKALDNEKYGWAWAAIESWKENPDGSLTGHYTNVFNQPGWVKITHEHKH